MSDKIHTDAEDILQELQNKNKQKVNNSCGCSHEEPESVAQTQSEGQTQSGCSLVDVLTKNHLMVMNIRQHH